MSLLRRRARVRRDPVERRDPKQGIPVTIVEGTITRSESDRRKEEQDHTPKPPGWIPKGFAVVFVEPDWTEQDVERTGCETYAKYMAKSQVEAKKSAEFHSQRVRAREGRAERPADASKSDDGWITIATEDDASEDDTEPRTVIV